MTYATQQDMVDRFGATELIQLTDRAAVPPVAIDATVLTRALADATAAIDGYLVRRYALPIAAPPPALVKVCADIARFYLWGDRADPKGAIAAAHAEALRWLRQVADDIVRLEVAGAASPAAASGGARVEAGAPVFSRDGLRGGP